ncbi:MAG: multiple sugar transport system permease protein [Pseudonocardiales bacterium]|jgi:multiple sugar transport system permease protein|nr:transrane sugar transport protein [Pseudonocardia sp.]MDT7557784.1 multiple sugar transport system permease protein [Pseudonocardiales bacterium]MDT7584424.1 multiple sugar transport system permease protein [Pseudonocardiales bacterium]MDT7633407.1 multiple sugar transport system permease protein [Pseudonocardiales bacterium]MDT7642246.1 multiple sugar transport system permease protein [Pseudonocardiales bacterium]
MHESRSYRLVRAVGLSFLFLFTVLPLYVMLSTSLKPLADVQDDFHWLPSTITLRPFVDIWSTVPLARYFGNSVVVAGCASVLSVTIAVFAAYAISRYTFRGREIFRMAVLSTQMFPGILFLLPLFLIYVNVGQATGIKLNGNLSGLIITYLTFSLPFSIWMLVGYFNSIPRELDEAALVDGASPVRALLSIIVPAAKPGIVAVGIYSFMTSWSESLFASVLTDENSKTLAVGLAEYSTQNAVYWNQIMAASLVVSLPVVLGFLLMQRYLVQGLTAGAVK